MIEKCNDVLTPQLTTISSDIVEIPQSYLNVPTPMSVLASNDGEIATADRTTDNLSNCHSMPEMVAFEGNDKSILSP